MSSKTMPAKKAAAETGSRTRGIDRAFEILDHLHEAKRPLRPNEIAIGIGAPKSTTYDIVGVLLNRGILEPADGDGRVFLGRRLYLFGLSHANQFDVMRLADGYLTRLSSETGQTAQFCVVENGKYVVAQMKEGEQTFRISSGVGEPVPLPWTASGRLLVSHLDNDAILKAIPKEDFDLPNGRRVSEKTFLKEVGAARVEGFHSNDSGKFTHCFAAAVYDEARSCVATLCLLTPREDGHQNHRRYKQTLLDAARDMSARIGGAAPSGKGK
jgi:DNA-binding IclR family transcriptional regulator